MATARKRGNWKFEDLEMATEEVKEGKLSSCKILHIPRSQ